MSLIYDSVIYLEGLWKSKDTTVKICSDPTSPKHTSRPSTLNKPAWWETWAMIRFLSRTLHPHPRNISFPVMNSTGVGRLGQNKNALNDFSRATCFFVLLHNTYVLRSCAHALLCLLETIQIDCHIYIRYYTITNREVLPLFMWPTDRAALSKEL